MHVTIDCFTQTQQLILDNMRYNISTINGLDIYLSHQSNMRAFDSFFEQDYRFIGIGNVLYNALQNHPSIQYSANIDEAQVGNLTEFVSREASTFVFFLWFVKDNSCKSTITTSFVGNTTNVHTNTYFKTIDVLYSDAKGLHEDTSFSEKEVNEAFKYFSLYDSLVALKVKRTIHIPTIGTVGATPNEISYNEFNRVARAIRFTKAARSTNFLPQKISHYIIVLECLFSADEHEKIQHKIAERIAKYIGTSVDDKTGTYKFIKKAYGIRSKYLHGQKLEKKHTELTELANISVRLDMILRTILRRILERDLQVFLLDDKKLGNWFAK